MRTVEQGWPGALGGPFPNRPPRWITRRRIIEFESGAWIWEGSCDRLSSGRMLLLGGINGWQTTIRAGGERGMLVQFMTDEDARWRA